MLDCLIMNAHFLNAYIENFSKAYELIPKIKRLSISFIGLSFLLKKVQVFLPKSSKRLHPNKSKLPVLFGRH